VSCCFTLDFFLSLTYCSFTFLFFFFYFPCFFFFFCSCSSVTISKWVVLKVVRVLWGCNLLKVLLLLVPQCLVNLINFLD
jgi:hypothetical protein